MSVKLSIGTPAVTMNPTWHGKWEEDATIDDIARVAETADRLGYHHMTCSEHVALPASEIDRRGARYWDPLATFGYLAARTQQIRFATYVLVLAYHHPLELAKRYGTLDVVSGGRVILGVGVGTLKEEFDLIGAPYDERGPRSDDALRALRASLGVSEPAYHGDYYDFEGMVVDPCAVQEHLPIWVGGRTLRSVRRAATLADGWCPFAVHARAGRRVAASGRAPAGLRRVTAPHRAPRPDQRTRSHAGHPGRDRGRRRHHRHRRRPPRDARRIPRVHRSRRHGASLTSIGTRAGLSRALPAHHFGSKDALVDRLAERAQERLGDAMVDAIQQSDVDGDEVSALDFLRFMVGAYLDLFVEPTPDDVALVALWGAVIPAEASVAGLVDADRRAVAGWAVVIERGQEDGSIRADVDPAAAGVALLALTRGVAALLLIDPELVDLAAVRRTCDDWIATALVVPDLD